MGRCPQTRSMVDTELEVRSLHEPGFFLGTSMAAQLLPAAKFPLAPVATVAAGPAPDSGLVAAPTAGLWGSSESNNIFPTLERTSYVRLESPSDLGPSVCHGALLSRAPAHAC
jgi:hypothetical protein